jgi:caffeoyl-CoA O-methyltransferase
MPPVGSPDVKAFGNGDPEITRYVERVFAPEDPTLVEIRERSDAAGLPHIQVGALDGLHLEVLARAFACKKAVEIGTLGGYSGVCLLRGMPETGKLWTFEIDPAHAEVARTSFAKAGFAARANVLVGPALVNLAKIEAEGPFDLVFIDADKESYPAYLDWAAVHLRLGGVVLGDNAFLFGEVIKDPDSPEAGGEAERIRRMRQFHDKLVHGGRFRSTMLPTGEGLALGVKIG